MADAIASVLLLDWAAAGVLGIVVVLAGLFHRGRAALAALVLLWAWAGLAASTGRPPLSDWPAPRLEAVLLLAPLDLLLIACLVETSLLSLRGLLVTVLLGIQTALGLWLPAWCWDAVWQFERLPARSLLGDHLTARGWPTPGLSAWVAVLAGLVAAVRWWRVRDPVLAGIAAAALMAGGIGYGMLVGLTPSLPLLGGGLALLIAVGWASYRLAFLDALTGLPGRRMLDERMVRLGRRWAVAMVDVDHFKKFNDEHGHEVGDQVLRMVAARLRHHFGGNAYRYGGEEFTLLFPGRSAATARARCETFRADIAERKLVLRGTDRPRRAPRRRSRAKRAQGLGVTVSIGVAERSAVMRRPEVLLKAADAALYKAKRGGRDQVVEHG